MKSIIDITNTSQKRTILPTVYVISCRAKNFTCRADEIAISCRADEIAQPTSKSVSGVREAVGYADGISLMPIKSSH